MQFTKKILVLKQIAEGYSSAGKPVSGIVRLEIEDGVATFYLSFVNVSSATGGSYRFFALDGKNKIYDFDLGGRPSSSSFIPECVPEIAKGFAAGLCYVSEDLPVLVAFQRSAESTADLSEFKRAVAEKCLSDRKNKPRETLAQAKKTQTAENERGKKAFPPAANDTGEFTADEQEEVLTEQPLFTDRIFTEIQSGFEENNEPETCRDYSPPPEYDDEAVATENYFALEEDIKNKISLIGDYENEYVRNEDGNTHRRDQKETDESQSGHYCFENETFAGAGEKYSERAPYYFTVQKELDDIFEKFPEEPSLKKLFPNSRWAKINYSEEKYYVVGLVKENGKEKYICYGIPSPYSERAPEELAPYCSFIPVSVFDMNGDGFWMMFQSATTGECIHLKDKRE